MRNNETLSLDFSNLSTNPSYHYRWSNGYTMFHRHNDFYEMSLVTQGFYTHYYGQTATKLEPGSLILFNINETHCLDCPPRRSCHFTLCVSKAYFQLLMQFLSIDENIFEKSNFISCKLDEHSLEYLKDIANKLTSGRQENANAKLFFINAMNLLIQHNHSEAPESDDIIDDIITNIRNYTYLTIPVQDIYAQYSLSIPTILKKFKQRTGMTVARYQTDVKFEYAAQMLRETNHSIDYIVDILGFCTSSHFFDTFKQYFGVTPKTYRKMNQPDLNE